MNEPRDPRHPPSASPQAASEADLAASELLEGWLSGSSPEDAQLRDATHGHDPRTARARAMLDARNVLRSHHDASSTSELDRLIERTLDQLGDAPPPDSVTSSIQPVASRRAAVRLQWAAAAAAVVVIVGIGTLVAVGTDSDESALDTADSAVTTRHTEREGAAAGATSTPTTTTIEGSTFEDAPAAETDTRELSPTSPDKSTGAGASGSSEGSDGSAADLDAQPPDTPPVEVSVFAGVHGTGRIRLP